MAPRSRENHILFLLLVGLAGWIVPGGGYAVLREKRHAVIIFMTIVLTFVMGLYIGSVGVINPIGAKPWYLAQILNSPAVALLGHLSVRQDFAVYGKPSEIGQIYTSIAGLLNLLCIVNAIYIAHVRGMEEVGD